MTRSEIIDKLQVHMNHLNGNKDDEDMFTACLKDMYEDLDTILDEMGQ